MSESVYDVAIIGGGPAGTSAALTLGRANREVILFDDKQPRNAAHTRIRGVSGFDGASRQSVYRKELRQLTAYPNITAVPTRVTGLHRLTNGIGFRVATCDRQVMARRVIFATGLRDILPPVPGLDRLYGRSVFHCAYCDGWEVRNRPWVFMGAGPEAIGASLILISLNRDVVLCTNGITCNPHWRRLTERVGLAVHEERVLILETAKGRLVGLSLESGCTIACEALFLKPVVRQTSHLLVEMGCIDDIDQTPVPSNASGQTCVPGVFVAGDCRLPWHQIGIAIGDGIKVAMSVNAGLALEPYGLRP
jgi:thioredoxin reductase